MKIIMLESAVGLPVPNGISGQKRRGEMGRDFHGVILSESKDMEQYQ